MWFSGPRLAGVLWDLKGIADDDVRGAEVDGGWILYLLGKFGRGGGLGLTVVYFSRGSWPGLY